MNTGMLRYGDVNVPYSVNENDRLRSRIRIHVLPDSNVVVEAPSRSSNANVQAAVQKRARWIVRQLSETAALREHALPRTYVSGEAHFYLGRRYRLKVAVDNQSQSCIRCVRGAIEVTLPINDPVAVRRRLRDWYAQRANVYFASRLSFLSSELPWLESPPKFRLLKMNKQWGSCSPSGNMNLNPSLIKAPKHCIDYVLIHELCHLKEHNHSKRFYALLDRHCEGWLARKAKLDEMAELLLNE
jgi:predicted metal-dependent hydrolase